MGPSLWEDRGALMAIGIYDLVSGVPSWTEYDGSGYVAAPNVSLSCMGDIAAASALPYDFRPLDFPSPCTSQISNQSDLGNQSNLTSPPVLNSPPYSKTYGPGVLLGCELSQGYRLENFTTTVGFVDDRNENFNLTIPDASGTILSTGSLNDIDRIGVLISPIVGQADASSKTRITFGDTWTFSNVTESQNQLSITRELHGFGYCTSSCSLPSCTFPFADTSVTCGSTRLSANRAKIDAFVVNDDTAAGCIYWFATNTSLDDNRPPVGSMISLDGYGGSIFKVENMMNMSKASCLSHFKATCSNGLLKLNDGPTPYFSPTALYLCQMNEMIKVTSNGFKTSIGSATIQTVLIYNLSLGIRPITSIVDEIQLAISNRFGQSRTNLTISLAPSGWGWKDHRQGSNISIDNFEDRQVAQSASASGFGSVSGWGSCLNIQSGTSRDPRKFYCAEASPSVQFIGYFTNATGLANQQDCFLIRTSNFSSQSSVSPDMATFLYPPSSVLELLQISTESEAQEQYWNPSSGLVMPAIKINSTMNAVRGVTATRYGSQVVNNTIYIPSSGDGIILSTGNLEDITLNSSRMTSLALNPYAYGSSSAALLINGYLEFGYMESGWSYESATDRVRNEILFPGPGMELVQIADDISGHLDIPGLNQRLASSNFYTLLTEDMPSGQIFENSDKLTEYLVAKTNLIQSDAALLVKSLLARCIEYPPCEVDSSRSFNGDQITTLINRLNGNDYQALGFSNFSSGIRLLLESNQDYAGLPVQMETLFGPTRKVLEFHKNAPEVANGKLALLTIPSVNGTVLTTANLEDITHGDGDIQSMSVAGRSWFDSQIYVGSSDDGKQQMILANNSLLWMGNQSATNISFSTSVRDYSRSMSDNKWISTSIMFPFEDGDSMP